MVWIKTVWDCSIAQRALKQLDIRSEPRANCEGLKHEIQAGGLNAGSDFPIIHAVGINYLRMEYLQKLKGLGGIVCHEPKRPATFRLSGAIR